MRHVHTLDANITEYDNCETSISDDSDDVICESAATHGEMTRFLNLTNKDMTELIGGDALSDKHVYAAQKLLQRKYPQVAGLQDSCLSQTRFNAIAPGDRDVVQIHHTRGNHWVVSAAVDGVVCVYDTLYDTLAPDLRKQLCEVYGRYFCSDAGKLVVVLPGVGKQRGSVDCGLFAIAIAYELCRGNDPSNVVFQQEEMRRHLYNCFEQRHLTSFPQFHDAGRQRKSHVEVIDCSINIDSS